MVKDVSYLNRLIYVLEKNIEDEEGMKNGSRRLKNESSLEIFKFFVNVPEMQIRVESFFSLFHIYS